MHFLLLLLLAGGVRGGWDNLLAIIPGGSSTPLLPKVGTAAAAECSIWPHCLAGEGVGCSP
jgi:NADH:ubiquinone oxidoreductase subunit F (NADH-binding)